MTVLYFMIPISLMLGFGALAAFIWSVFDGQYDDVETPAHRILEDEQEKME
jgi:cbb3-type cytochrome oxidase maturation protein